MHVVYHGRFSGPQEALAAHDKADRKGSSRGAPTLVESRAGESAKRSQDPSCRVQSKECSTHLKNRGPKLSRRQKIS